MINSYLEFKENLSAFKKSPILNYLLICKQRSVINNVYDNYRVTEIIVKKLCFFWFFFKICQNSLSIVAGLETWIISSFLLSS